MKYSASAFLAVLAADQLSKHYVVEVLNLRELRTLEVFPPLLNFRMGWNTGINFGLMDGDSEVLRWALAIFAAAVAAALLWWGSREGRGRGEALSAGAVAGGAAGNALDRLMHGAVADFLNMSCCGIHNPFVFNVADVAVFAGALGLVAFAGRSGGRG